MAKISAVDFANNVERNRKSLIRHCLANGKDVLESETLDNVVAINNTINTISTSTPDGKFKVEFKDLDGNYFAPTQYVDAGGSVELPTGYPELDSEILEFVEWTANGDLTNVQDNLVCLPVYQTKFSEVANQRPTILKCYFDENTLSPTLQLGSTNVNAYVNWGDGSEARQVTANKVSHTYANAGLYNIMIYGDSYTLGGNATAGVFTNDSYKYALLKAYLGEKVTSIVSYAFQNCVSLTSVIIPNSVTSNGTYAFQNCVSLTSIIIPSSMTSIRDYEFKSCSSLTSIIIPSSVTRIGREAFSSCNSLKSVTIPSSVTGIGSGAFSSCSSLTSVTIPSSVTSIETSVFSNCRSLTSITIPSSVTSIGVQAFENCYSLTSITIPSMVTHIWGSSFANCYSLTSITIPSSVTYMGSETFYNCNSLKSVTIPSGVTSIENSVFAGCSSLTSVTIPSSVTRIYSYTFSGCYALTDFVLHEDCNISGIDIKYCQLSDESLIDIANKLKDNTGGITNTITFSISRHRSRMNTIYLDTNGARVPYGTAGAVSILEFIQNKNWTVSFS